MATWEGKPTLASVLKDYIPPTESALADPIKEHFRTLPQQLATNQAALDSAIGSWNKTDFGTGLPNPNYRPEAIQELTQLMPNVMGATAWHGTPHKIQGNFDINKVGTGEGNQTFSHGMYFAENPKVASQYQKALSGRTDLGQMPSDPAFVHAVESFRESGYPLEKIPEEMKKAYKSVTDKDIKLAIQATEKGNLYKVDIPDEYLPNMLHWDKPLTEQSPQVKKALESLGIKTDKQKLNEFDNALLEALTGDARTTLPNQPKNPLGSEVYEKLLKGDPASKSAKLNELGIKGVSYLDEGSRGWRMLNPEESTSGKYVVGKWPGGGPEQKYFDNLKEAQDYYNKNQTRNHVVFEPSKVKILEENGKPLTRKELIEKELKKVVE